MKLIIDFDFINFEGWDGGEIVYQAIMKHGKDKEFDAYIDKTYPDGISDDDLNDLLISDRERIYQLLGINESEQEVVNVAEAVLTPPENTAKK